jgi:hypothetical protein
MPERSKGRGQTKCSPWSSRLRVGRGANDPTSEKFTVAKPPETCRGGPWRRSRPTQGCSAGTEEEEEEFK